MLDVNAVELKECLIEDLRVGITSMVASSPGMGKSDIIRSVAKQFNLLVIDIRVSQCEPVDMQGFPGIVNNRMTFHVPEYFPIEGDELPDRPKDTWKDPNKPEKYDGWLIFLDEFNSGNKQTEAAGYKLILDKEVYKHKLHKNVRIVAAGNLNTDRAIVNTPSTATTSRLTHYRLRIDHEAWLDWANEHHIDHRIISFIKFKPSILHQFDPATNELTFPCPRTWEFASKIVLPKPTITPVTRVRLAGTIGEGAAIEFTTFTEIYKDLPTIEKILQDPKKGWTPPTEISRQFAITTMLSHNAKEDNLDKIIIANDRLPMEFRVITFKDIYKRNPAFKKHPIITDWISKNASNLF